MRIFHWLLFLVLSFCQCAHALPVARMRGVRPIVETQNGGASWKLARERGALIFGDTVRTGAGGKAEILFNNGTQIALRQQTQVQILAPPGVGKPLVLRVFGALSEIFVRAKGPTEIRTAAGTAAVRGTQYLVRLDAENQTRVTVSEGKVAFYNPQGEVLVAAGQQSSAVVGSAPTPPVAVDVSGLLGWTSDVAQLPILWEFPVSQAPLETLQSRAQNSRAATDFDALGIAQSQRGDARGAAQSFALALSQNPDSDVARAGLLLSQIQLHPGDTFAAPANVPDSQPISQSVSALLLLQASFAPAATTILRGVTARHPELTSAQSLLALALLEGSDIAGAQKSAQMAVQNAPSSPLAHAALSMALFFAGDDRKARLEARRALQLDPLSPLALLSYGRTEAALGNLDEARQAIEQAAVLAPDLPLAERDLGAIYTHLDRLPKAEAVFRAVLLKNGADATALAGLGTVLGRTGRETDAKTAFDAATLAAPRDPFVAAQRATFLIENGHLEQARRETEAFLSAQKSAGPEMGAVFIRLSEAALYRQNLAEALDFGRRAVKLLPQSAPAHYQLGRVFLEQERTSLAQDQFRLAVALDPLLARARFAVGLTQERIASGREAARPLGQIAAASEGSAARALSVQNVLAPGANSRLQASIQDPTVVRSATRSYGDAQIDGALGNDGLRDGEISLLKASSDQRGLIGIAAARDENDGVRPTAAFKTQRVGLTLGRKQKGSPSGFFGLFQDEKGYGGNDRGAVSNPILAGSRSDFENPLAILGYNQTWSQNSNTRFLLQRDSAKISQGGSIIGDTTTIRYRGLHGEIRHDVRWREGHLLSVGGSFGRRTLQNQAFLPGDPIVPSIHSNSDRTLDALTVYAREDFAMTPRLRLVAELKGQRLRDRQTVLATFAPIPLPPAPNRFETASSRKRFVGLPTFLATYQLSPRTSARLRARRIFGTLFDFESLSPTDIFVFDTSDEPFPAPLGRGRAYEAELSHSFANASFFKIGFFQQSAAPTANVAGQESLLSGRFRGVRMGYEGFFGAQTTYFANLDLNNARGDVNLDGAPVTNAFFSSVPRVRGELGVQYLSESGFFVQPSLAYIGNRLEPLVDAVQPRAKSGGFALLSARVGKRWGLRSSVFVEALNLLDKSYTIYGGAAQRLQPGRQFRIGFSRRF